jgi:DNA-binding transcriptional ArsR family regulator
MDWGTRRFRVLDTLARTIGESHSLRSFADQVKNAHGTGHYPNVRNQLRRLQSEGIVTFEKAGRSKVPRLRFEQTGFPDTMAALELWRKRSLLDDEPTAREAMAKVEAKLTHDGRVRSMSLVDPERNVELRRLELLVLVQHSRQQAAGGQQLERDLDLATRLADLENDTALRVDAWAAPADRFGERLTSPNANPAPRILRDQTCIWNPQALWRSVAASLPHGTGLAPSTPRRLSSVEEDQIAANLARWGYEERGREVAERSTSLCPEAVVVAALVADIPRWIGAAGLVLAKADFDPGLLTYLAKAEDQADRLAGIVEILHERDPDPEFEHTLQLLEALEVQPQRIEQAMVTDALDLYGG